MSRIKLFCIGLIALSISSAWIVKNDPFNELLKKLEEFTKKYPQEKVHLHLDKPYYAIGDDIWFKAYVTNTKTSSLTTLSQILYVELIDEKDSLKQQLKLPLLNGIGWNDFKLPDSLSEGNYRIRAYTQLMRNAGPDFFFDKTIKIGNSWANKVFTKTYYLFSQEGANEKVNSTIQFSDKQGKPYADSDVNYEVVLGTKTILKGKATTNTNGEISIPILNTQPNVYKAGRITATITLADKQKITKVIPLTTTSSAVDVQFFPESGALLAGLPIKVALKAVNAQGKGEDVKGVIVESDGTELTSFETSHLGMGSFYLNPMAGKTYQAKIKFKNGSEKIVDLPKVASSGYALSVNNTDTSKVTVKVLLTDDLVGKGDLHLLAQQNGSVCFFIKVPTGKNAAILTVAKDKFPSGIIALTLFNETTIPVAERLIFVNNKTDQLDVGIAELQQAYGKRDLMSLNLTSTNMGKPATGSFSVAVTNATVVNPDTLNEANIFTSLLLTSDLKGYVENPNYYFLSDDAKTHQALDHLLLTQGWRKIDWQAINGSLELANFQPEKYLQIAGSVTTNAGKSAVNAKVSLFSSSHGLFVLDTLTDANGRFSFNDLQFPDSAKFIIKALNAKGKRDIRVKLDVISRQLITTKNKEDIEINVNEQLKGYLQNSDDYFEELTKQGLLSKTIQLKKVDIFGKQERKVIHSANLNGPGKADAIITAKDLENTIFLEDYLGTKVMGIQMRDGVPFSTRSTFDSSGMAIVMDGMLLQDFKLKDINVSSIETVEVLRSMANTAAYGSSGGSGVLVITSKRGDNTVTYPSVTPDVISYSPKGFSINREFYSPMYNVTAINKQDLRTTVYWNPAVFSDENGRFKLEYFNTDQPGFYRVLIEGIDGLGRIARKTFIYQVN